MNVEAIRCVKMLHTTGAVELTRIHGKSQYVVHHNLSRVCLGYDVATIAKEYVTLIAKNFVGSNCKIGFDVIYGPLHHESLFLSAISLMWKIMQMPDDFRFCTTRTEIGAHFNGGVFVGAPILASDRILLLTDAVTDAHIEKRAIDHIIGFGGTCVGVVTAIDMQNKGISSRTVVQEMIEQTGIPVCSIMTKHNIIKLLT